MHHPSLVETTETDYGRTQVGKQNWENHPSG